MAEHKIPGGRDKDKPINEASDEGIKWWLNKKREELAADPEGKWASNNKAWIAAAEAELAGRAGGSKQAAPNQQRQAAPARHPSTALAGPQRTAALEMAGAWHEAKAVDAELRRASESMHLVAPATVCGALPEGCEVALSIVYVDPNDGKDGPGEVYSVGGGKFGLSATTLARIGAAAGIDWDMERSGRLDNGRDPHYVHYRAVGTVRNFDGSVRTVSGEVEIDAREGSPQIDEIKKKAEKKRREHPEWDNDGGDSQILELRKFALRHAERKAKSRAIADMGIKRSYNKDELKKPFAVARLMATGRSNDPELRREFARMNFDKMTSGRAALYGAPTHAAPRLSPPATLPALAPHERAAENGGQFYAGHEPPPLGGVHDAEGETAPDSEPYAANSPPTAEELRDSEREDARY